MAELRRHAGHVRPTPLGELYGVGRLIHMGSTVAFVEGELRTPDGALTARCTATLRIVQGKAKKRTHGIGEGDGEGHVAET